MVMRKGKGGWNLLLNISGWFVDSKDGGDDDDDGVQMIDGAKLCIGGHLSKLNLISWYL